MIWLYNQWLNEAVAWCGVDCVLIRLNLFMKITIKLNFVLFFPSVIINYIIDKNEDWSEQVEEEFFGSGESLSWCPCGW